MSTYAANELQRLTTGIPGLDHITNGGLTKGRSTVIAGTAGTGKTLLAIQYIVTGVRAFDQPGVIVTFEEAPMDLLQNVGSFGWNVGDLVAKKK